MQNECKSISDKEYWEKQYLRSHCGDLQLDGFTNRPNKLISEKILPLISQAGSVLEVGAGDSLWLPYLASKFPEKSFTGLDYSLTGCDRLRESVDSKGLKVDVVHADMFDPPEYLLGKMDLVLSFGVVEHFTNLSHVLSALGRFVTVGGVIFTIIPNMHGVLGTLTRHFDRSVYDIHFPHDLNSFLAGHQEAGFDVCEAGYLCSSNFGILSSAVPTSGVKFEVYKWLTRLSKLGWFFEEKFIALPATSYFSAFIYCIAKAGDRKAVK